VVGFLTRADVVRRSSPLTPDTQHLTRALMLTLAIIKPDAVKRGLAGRSLRISRLRGSSSAPPASSSSHRAGRGLYEVHRERPFYRSLVTFMTSGPAGARARAGRRRGAPAGGDRRDRPRGGEARHGAQAVCGVQGAERHSRLGCPGDRRPRSGVFLPGRELQDLWAVGSSSLDASTTRFSFVGSC